MSAPAARPPRIQIPRWIQLVGFPLLLLFGWVLARAASHALFLFLVAALLALLLDPIVLGLGRARIRRGFSVAFVYVTFAGALLVIVVSLATVVVGQTRTAANRFNAYFTEQHGRSHQVSADRDVDRLQHWLNTHHLRSIKIEKSGHRLVKRIRDRDVGKYTHRVVNFVEGAAISIGRVLFDGILILVVSIYMLLGMERFARFVIRSADQRLRRQVEHDRRLCVPQRGRQRLEMSNVAVDVTQLVPQAEGVDQLIDAGRLALLARRLRLAGPPRHR